MATFRGTSGTDTFSGGTANDLFVFDAADLSPRDTLSGGGGTNILAIQNTDDDVKVFTRTSLRGLSDISAIALDAAGGYGFEFQLSDAFFTTNHETTLTIDQGTSTGVLQWLHVLASSVTTMTFRIGGTGGAQDELRTGTGDDVFIYRANAFDVRDIIDGGQGVDTLVLAGAGATTRIKDGGTTTDPNGVTALANVKNVEAIVVTDLARGQSRTIDFGNLAGTARYAGSGTIAITTDKNYLAGGTAAAIDGVVVVNGDRLKATQVLHATGGNAADRLTGGAGADTLNGGKGNDTLTGGLGGDHLAGGAGDDGFVVTDAAFGRATGQFYHDAINGGTGFDVLSFTAPHNLILSAAAMAANTVTAIEAIRFTSGRDVGMISLTLDKAFLANNHDADGHLTVSDGFSFDDRSLVVDASANVTASLGLVVEVNGTGTETLTGGAGADTFDYSKAFGSNETVTLADRIDGGGGVDTLLLAEGADAQLGAGVRRVESVKVLALDTGPTTTEVDLATAGTITIDGRALGASDSLVVRGRFAVADGSSNPTLHEATGRITALGGAGADTLVGGLGNDTLSGGAGADVILAYAGADRLTGGTGADIFFYMAAGESTVAAAGQDTITDFSQAQGDRIGFIHTNTPSYQFIGAAGFHHIAGEVRSVVSGGATSVEADFTGDGVADLKIALTGIHTLTAADFYL